MKKFSLFLTLALIVSLLAGCAGTPVVYYTECDCPEGAHDTPVQDTTPAVKPETPAPAEGMVWTGLSVITDISGSKNAAEEDGEAKYDVTVVAVNVGEDGTIHACAIDSIGTSVKFDASGAITSDLTAEILTKNELGDAYGMKAYGGAKYEWNEQAAALAQYAVGKNTDALEMAIDESGYATDVDLASTATINLGSYVEAIKAAAQNAQYLGGKVGDELRLATISAVDSSAAATAEKAGNAQLDVNVAVLTMDGETITGCILDALQAKVAFGTDGVITTDLTAPVQTKNELGEAYGMKAYAGSKYEWNEQAAAFAQYATGKTAAEVSGIAVSEGKVTDTDLASTVTISVGGFQAIIEKAAQ